MNGIPQRIVCLSAETADVLYRLGAGDLVVGVSGYTIFPLEAREKPTVSAYTTFRYDVIESLKPDMILAYSYLQTDAVRELGKRGYPVLLTNQQTLRETLETLVMVGRIAGKQKEAESLAGDLQSQIDAARQASRACVRRPKVYFEEWDDPLITGIPWISELIDVAGGEDIFPEMKEGVTARERMVTPDSIIERAPDIIIASWCGKKANLEAIRSRPGWDAIPAVRDQQVHEIKSAHCLQPGPTLITEGLPRFCSILRNWQKMCGQ